MLFDFDKFTISTKLAYRRCEASRYSLDEVLQVFKYYFDTYEIIFNEAHPMISINQIIRIIEKMPCVLADDYESGNFLDISLEDYRKIIDQHFNTKYNGGNCDYNINHFFSGKIRDMRFYEVCY